MRTEMPNTTRDPRSISISAALYRLLLLAYPSRFRHEYGAHMAQVFGNLCLRTYRHSGPPGMFSLWALTLFDLFKTVVEEHLQRGVEMTREKFIRLSGWGMILGALAIPLGVLAEPGSIRRLYYDFFGSVTTAQFNLLRSISEGVDMMLFLSGFLLLNVGVLGLLLHYGNRVGRFGKTSLLLSIAGGGISIIIIGLAFTQADGWWGVFRLGLVVQFAFLALFGIAALREKPFARWNSLPFLAGVWIPLWLTISWIYKLQTGVYLYEELPSWIEYILLLVMFGSLALLGQTLQSDPTTEGQLAE